MFIVQLYCIMELLIKVLLLVSNFFYNLTVMKIFRKAIEKQACSVSIKLTENKYQETAVLFSTALVTTINSF